MHTVRQQQHNPCSATTWGRQLLSCLHHISTCCGACRSAIATGLAGESPVAAHAPPWVWAAIRLNTTPPQYTHVHMTPASLGCCCISAAHNPWAPGACACFSATPRTGPPAPKRPFRTVSFHACGLVHPCNPHSGRPHRPQLALPSARVLSSSACALRRRALLMPSGWAGTA